MNKYLVVIFDRHDTTDSLHYTTEADTPSAALLNATIDNYKQKHGIVVDQTELDYLTESLQQVSDNFSCISEEEIDYLVYKI